MAVDPPHCKLSRYDADAVLDTEAESAWILVLLEHC